MLRAPYRTVPGFSGEHLERYMRNWAADCRERQQWRDQDSSTYRFRANVLEGALNEISRLRERLIQAEDQMGAPRMHTLEYAPNPFVSADSCEALDEERK